MPLVAFGIGNYHSAKELVKYDYPVWMESQALRHWPVERSVDAVVWNTGFTPERLWNSRLEQYDVIRAVGPAILSASDWKYKRSQYQRTQMRVRSGVVVRTRMAECIKSIPDRYAVALDPIDHFDPWSQDGRRVWIYGAKTQRQVWERYCELHTVGVQVAGILLPPVMTPFRRPLVLGGDLHYHVTDGLFAEDRVRLSLQTLRNFWLGVTKLYDGTVQ